VRAWAWGLAVVGRMRQASLYAFDLCLSAEVENVVDTILFLLSNRSGMTTGSTLPVDGGFLAT
jgi:NAD(P)-dependent dehydrogenase (short-subunit alcohol dehydrogenase family)